jgi:hypothetical protein
MNQPIEATSPAGQSIASRAHGKTTRQNGFLPRVMRDELVEPFHLCDRAPAYPLVSRVTRFTNPPGTVFDYGASS